MVKIYAKYEHFLFQLDKFIRTLKRSNIEKPNFFFLSFVILIFFFHILGIILLHTLVSESLSELQKTLLQ